MMEKLIKETILLLTMATAKRLPIKNRDGEGVYRYGVFNVQKPLDSDLKDDSFINAKDKDGTSLVGYVTLLVHPKTWLQALQT